jgi:DNA-binding response OmpR family regulator
MRAALKRALELGGFEVWLASDGAEGLDAVETVQPDLVVLDILMPGVDGFDVCRTMRSRGDRTPILMLTARDSVADRVEGLEAGADDYLVKPIRLAELHARIRAHLRRNEATGAAPSVRSIGDLVVDVSRRRVTVSGQELRLRPKEFDLLACLAARPDVALTRETLMSEVWDENWFGSTKTLDVHVAALRRKMAEIAALAGAQVPEIVTLRGHGYRLALDPPASDGVAR